MTHFPLFLKSSRALRRACIEAYESAAKAPASMYIPLMLSLFFALWIPSSRLSRPMLPVVLPCSWLMMLSSPRSVSCHERFSTSTEFASGSLVASCDAIIPATVMSAKKAMTMLKRSIPTNEAKTNLKNCFIKASNYCSSCKDIYNRCKFQIIQDFLISLRLL